MFDADDYWIRRAEQRTKEAVHKRGIRRVARGKLQIQVEFDVRRDFVSRISSRRCFLKEIGGIGLWRRMELRSLIAAD